MRLGDVLLARGLVDLAGIERAVEAQKENGGRLGDNLVALGLITIEQLEEIIHETPRSPKSMAGTGIPANNLLQLMLKFMYVEGRETPVALMNSMKLPYTVVKALLDDAVKKKMLQSLGAAEGGGMTEIRYILTEYGRSTANEALARNLYLGPTPVSLEAYTEQVLKQRITNEVTDESTIRKCFSDLIVPDHFLGKIGPAINSGRTVLLYGPPGNGKTSIATRVADIFKHIIYIPFAFEVEGQIIQLYDSAVHKAAVDEESAEALTRQTRGLRKEEFDQRWIPCRRPVVIVGGELSLEMLDLQFSEEAKFYEAPMHVKAINGTFIIDDFGRQLVSPEALLNRWIVPMESRIDFFKLHTGKSFRVPFDELLIFSTNLAPDDLMDPAFLRRIPYKIELFEPSKEDFRRIFNLVAKAQNLELTDEILNFVARQLQNNGYHLAYYQPKFVVDQVVAMCKYAGEAPSFTLDRVKQALQNLYVKINITDPREAPEIETVTSDDDWLPPGAGVRTVKTASG